MYQNTVQLLFKRNTILAGILPHPICTNHYVTGNKPSCDIIERDNISIGIMCEIMPINLEEILIITKKVVDITHRLSTLFYHLRKPLTYFFWIGKLKISGLGGKSNSHRVLPIFMIYNILNKNTHLLFLKMPALDGARQGRCSPYKKEKGDNIHAATVAQWLRRRDTRSMASEGSIPATTNSRRTRLPPHEKVILSARRRMIKIPSPTSSAGRSP